VLFRATVVLLPRCLSLSTLSVQYAHYRSTARVMPNAWQIRLEQIETSMSDPSNIFGRCIQPLDADTFFSEYWEKKPLIISRTQPDYFSDLLSLDAVDKILTSTNLRVPGFRLVRQGS